MPRKFKIGFFSILGLSLLLYFVFKPVCWWSVLSSASLKQTDGFSNLLLLGVPGGTHAGADMTDTMILTVFNQKTGKLTLVSLPRDIWSSALQDKINSAYHFGEEKKKDGGFVLAKTLVGDISGMSVHYAVKMNLSGVKEIVNLLGGIEINVDTGFDDYKFPVEGKENDTCNGDPEYKCRFLHVHFDAGPQVLDGERALQYIRSRQAEGDEGTDFARNRRQQKVILALKTKILSPALILSPSKWIPLYREFDKAIDTDIPQKELPYFWKILAAGLKQVKTLEIDQLLTNPPTTQYKDLWVLVPKTGSFEEIHNYLKQQTQN